MKKMFTIAALIVAVTFTSCNSGAKTEVTNADSTVVAVDSVQVDSITVKADTLK
jgi:hypothetical protein